LRKLEHAHFGPVHDVRVVNDPRNDQSVRVESARAPCCDRHQESIHVVEANLLQLLCFPLVLVHDLDESLEKIDHLFKTARLVHESVRQLAANDLEKDGRVHVIQYFSNSTRLVEPWLAQTKSKVQRKRGIDAEARILFKKPAKEVVPSRIVPKGIDVAGHAPKVIEGRKARWDQHVHDFL
jgi:hypothetical protein